MTSNIIIKILRFWGDTTRQNTEKKTVHKKIIPNTEEWEYCVICGTLTDIPTSIPIDRRENFVAGCGQICTKCANKLRKSNASENILTNSQIMLAVEKSKTNKV